MSGPESGGASEAGVRVERRLLLGLPFAVVGGRVLFGAPLAAQEAGVRAAEGAFELLAFAEFGKRWQALAEALGMAPEAHDESYAAQLAGLVARVPVAELPRLDTPRRKGVTGGLAWSLAPCALIEFRMDPGAVIRLHNHPPQVVLSLCAEGEVAYRHFEIEGEAPPCTEIDGGFLARETRAGFLAAGRSTSLTRERDGMHGFVAGKEGARLIDFTVATTADVETFSYVELAPEAVDRERRVFEAVWVGKR